MKSLDDARAGLGEQRRQDGRRVKSSLAHRRIPTAPPLRDLRSTPNSSPISIHAASMPRQPVVDRLRVAGRRCAAPTEWEIVGYCLVCAAGGGFLRVAMA